MKKIFILSIIILVIILLAIFNCQQAGNSGGGGGGGGDDDPPSKWASQSKIIASDAGDDDWFGNSVSMSGDYAIVGAYYKNGIGTCRGAAYVFHRTGTNTWGDADKIIATDPNDLDCFGYSVSMSGDYAIVGASNEDGINGAWMIDRGAAYIYHRIGANNWAQGFKIIASDYNEYDNFGTSVSISGDYAIVGAFREDGAGTDRGAAYIFQRGIGNDWAFITKLTAPDTADNDNFGISVSMSGDYAIVGAFNEDGIGTNRGAAYIFHRTGVNTWNTEIRKIAASDAGDNDWFGYSVSISGDYAIVGALYKNDGGIRRGAAYIYHRYDVNSWDFIIKLAAPDAGDDDEFGNSVSISGDNVIIGAHYEDGMGTNRGAAYIFHNREGTNAWDFVSKITAYDPEDGSIFGASVSLSGEYAIIGAQYKDGIGINSGAAYILK